ncbi:proteoglycan 4a [Parambassis ranga]|uniref:Proteoglycan 4a n=1 Tax=Parambassis ranga TaxID=210632 RepID=A0A6P7K224_9TELE|nr:proteoglycan 4-like [Parambassis ranga]
MSLGLLLLGFVVTSAAAGPGSCVGRCGEVFTRGQQCTCDFSCLQHNECCQDFEATCTIAQSCQGRCGQTFRRGQLCECDPMCVTYNTCCHDYQRHCDASVFVSHQRTFQSLRATASKNRKSGKSKKRSNSESEEWYRGMNNIPVGLLPMPVPPSHSGAPWSSAPGSSYLPSNIAPSPGGGGAPVSPSTAGGTGSQVNVQLVVSPGGVHPSKPNQGQTGAADSRPSTLQDVAQALGLSLAEGGPGGPGTGNFDADLCSDSPINGLTALPNGTILIFKGELFWSVDPVTRSVGQPQSITDTLGVPSPIDTVFTRSNCHGHTYIIKGDQYWRLDENLAMEPGFPKPLASEFPGLTGSITAALAVAATRSKPETVYFFKSGDVLQKFTFPSGSTPPCGKKPGSPLNRRFARQAEVLLSGEINIKVSLKGFPTPITSALSMPSPQGSDRYNHYVFSGPLFFSVQITGDLPELAKPDPSAALAPLPILSPAAAASNTAASNTAATNAANMAALSAKPPHPANSIRVWLNCP